MARLNIGSISEMYTIMNATVTALLDQFTNQEGIRSERPVHSKRHREQANEIKSCKYHSACKRQTKYCRYLRQKGSSDYQTDKPKNNYAIREAKSNIRTLDLSAYIESQPYKVTMDSGSTFNYIEKKS
ncbi:hypothetical protein EQH57_0461 [Dictyocoela roeselum]|nr:hypothetical protein EQH57_0461 [Dictyocoela roeselum]